MKDLNKILFEFHKADMRKLKECQGLRIQAYQHLDNHIEGDKVRYQPMNDNSWLGPAIVLCYSGLRVWLLASGEIKKVAACKDKPYELLDREKNKEREVTEKIMLEDGLKNVDKKTYPEKEELNDSMLVGAILACWSTVSKSG